MATVFDPQTEPIVDSDMLYEVVDGEIVEKKMGAYELMLGNVLNDALSPFVRAKGLGRSVVEMIFRFPVNGQQRRPDVAFVSFARWPKRKSVPRTPAWGVVPELAVEVVSPTNTMNEVFGKVREYFAEGVEAVWVVLPEYEQVHVFDSPVSNCILTRDDELTGDPVIPGFRLPLAELFVDETEQGAAESVQN